MDNVDLEFQPDALAAIADLALERGTGARGLRAILEHTLLEAMYDVPGRTDIAKVVVTPEAVRGEATLLYVARKATRSRRAS
jgi:ATP-dependent Clp protease ATP-binding subunit ClpX